MSNRKLNIIDTSIDRNSLNNAVREEVAKELEQSDLTRALLLVDNMQNDTKRLYFEDEKLVFDFNDDKFLKIEENDEIATIVSSEYVKIENANIAPNGGHMANIFFGEGEATQAIIDEMNNGDIYIDTSGGE